MKKYELLEHTAEIGIKAYGENEKELFENLAEGMFSITADLENVKPEVSCNFEASAENTQDLVFMYLSRLLYLFETKNILFCRFEIEKLQPGRKIAGKAWGEPLNREKHKLLRDIKAVTFHNLEVKKNKVWSASVIFDI